MDMNEIIKAFESARIAGGVKGLAVKAFLLPPDEIESLTDTLRSEVLGYVQESKSICSSILGISLIPNSFVRAVVFAEDYYAILYPGRYDWHHLAIFPVRGIAGFANNEESTRRLLLL